MEKKFESSAKDAKNEWGDLDRFVIHILTILDCNSGKTNYFIV